MSSKFFGLLFAGLFVFTLNGSVMAQDCPTGYVNATCKNEAERVKAFDCELANNFTITDTTGGTTTTQTGETTEGCTKIKEDLADCQKQCIPQVTNGNILPGPKNGATAKNYLVGNFLPNLTNSFLIFIMVLGVGFLVAAGFMWIFSAGNEELTSRARRTVIWTIIGLIVAVISYLLVQIVININFFG